MKKITLLALALILIGTACKKKKEDPAPTPTPTPTPTQPTTFNGWCRVYNQYQYLIGGTGTTYLMSLARSFFTTDNLTTTNTTVTPAYVFGGLTVANNVDTLQYYGGTYEKNLAAGQYSVPVKWSVAGNGSIPSFTANCSETFPGLALSSFSVFPANISKNAGFNVTLTGFSNTDRLILYLQDNSGNYVQSTEQTLSNGNVTFSFSGAQTASFINTNLGLMYLYLYNDGIQTVNGKNIRFSNVTQYYINGFNINN